MFKLAGFFGLGMADLEAWLKMSGALVLAILN